MPTERELRKLASRIVEGMLIGRKPNQKGIERVAKAVPGVGKIIRKLAGRKLSQKQLDKLGLGGKQIEALLKPDYGPLLVRRGKNFLFRGTIGEAVRLRYHPQNWPLAKHIILEAARRGASVSGTPDHSQFDRELMLNSSFEALEDFTPLAKAVLENADVTIYLETEDDPEWRKGLPSARLQAGREKAQRSHEILDKRKVRWLYVGWPFPATARKLGVAPKFFEKMVFDSLEQSFSKKTAQLVSYYCASLNNKNLIRIAHEDGTDLRFSVRGRPILRDLGRITQHDLDIGDVGLNLPSGEVFVAPLETTAEGKIFFPKIMVDGHGFTQGLELIFKKGRVEKYSAEKNEVNFRKYLEENTPSTRVLAELGIGCNPAAKYSGYILTDEKIFGTLHLAIGNNTGSYHGRNKASGHLDMVKDMKRGVLYADGKPIMAGGRPVKQGR